MSGLKNVSQIHQWAADDRAGGFLKEKFGIEDVPCYYWLLCLLKLVEPVLLNRCFNEWVKSMIPKSVEGKSNEIPTVQELLEELDISGCIIVADALNCQKNTAKAILSGGADYVLSVKDNQPCLKQDIADYVGDTVLRGTMDRAFRTEKNRNRTEKRSAFVMEEIGWLTGREE